MPKRFACRPDTSTPPSSIGLAKSDLEAEQTAADELDKYVDSGSRPADVIDLLLQRVPVVDEQLVLPAPNVDGLPAYRIRAVIPMGSLDNGVYDGIWEVEPV